MKSFIVILASYYVCLVIKQVYKTDTRQNVTSGKNSYSAVCHLSVQTCYMHMFSTVNMGSVNE